MNKIKNLLFIVAVLFICSITINVKAAVIQIGINENGTVSNLGDPSLSNRYTMNDNTLTLTTIDSSDSFVIQFANHDFNLTNTNDVNLVVMQISGTVNIESQNKITINGGIMSTGNGVVNINDSSNIVINSANGLKEFNVNNSNVTVGSFNGPDVRINNSVFTFTNTGQSIKSLYIDKSTIYGGGVHFGTDESYNSNYEYIIKDSNLIFDDQTNGFGSVYFNGADTYIENSDITTKVEFRVPYDGKTEIKDSTIKYGSQFYGCTNSDSPENDSIKGLRIYNSNIVGNYMILNTNTTLLIEYSEIDTSRLNLWGEIHGNQLIKNSTIKSRWADHIATNEINNSNILFYHDEGNAGGSINFGNLINSDFYTENSVTYLYDVDNSNVVTKNASVIYFNDSNIKDSMISSVDGSNDFVRGTIKKMDHSSLYAKSSNNTTTQLTINNFVNSHLISQGNIAFILENDISDLGQIEKLDENGNDLGYEDIDDNGTTRKGFIKNGGESDYVEIRSVIYVTVKVKNGTWSDGTTDNKVIKTYAGVNFSNIELPNDMLALSGYKNGSWDKVYDGLLYDNVELTYTFYKESEQAPETKIIKAGDEEENDIVNPKTGEDIKSQSILLIISVIGLISIVYLRRIKKALK